MTGIDYAIKELLSEISPVAYAALNEVLSFEEAGSILKGIVGVITDPSKVTIEEIRDQRRRMKRSDDFNYRY